MRTMDEIYSALAGRFVSGSGAVLTEGGDMSLRLKAVAAEIFTLEAQAEFLSRQCFPQTASGTYLDSHAALRGLVRGSAQKAAGTLRFYLEEASGSAVSIPAGTQCMTAAGTVFLTAEAGQIAPGETACTVAAYAGETGSGGNVPADTVTYIVHAPAGVSGVTNDAAFAGGTDGEDDEALRERVLASYRTLPNGANVAYYENKVLGVDGVEAVTVLPRSRGLGTVDVVFAMPGGVPDAAKIAEVRSLLDSEREISVDLQVAAPTIRTVNVAAVLKIADGSDFNEVKAAAEAALRAYFTGKRLSGPVYRARLSSLLMEVDGVENCTLAQPGSDVAAEDGMLPVLGTVSISKAV